jgi:HD-like signal output (HDOD) protein
VRIVLSGQTKQESLLRSLASIHLFLGKPCDTEMLKHRLRDVLRRGDHIRDESLKSLVAHLGAIPSLPVLFVEIMKLFSAEAADIETLAKLVSMDMGMSSTVLHFVNSGYFGSAAPMASPERAVCWLGSETVRDLIVANRLSCSCDTRSFRHFDMLSLWNNSMSTAASARQIALSHCGDSTLADDAFAAGLFHDIGQVALASILGTFYDSVLELAISRGEPLWQTEREVIGSTHAEVGAYLLGLWGMPETVVNVIASHHSYRENSIGEFTALTALSIAGMESHEANA